MKVIINLIILTLIFNFSCSTRNSDKQTKLTYLREKEQTEETIERRKSGIDFEEMLQLFLDQDQMIPNKYITDLFLIDSIDFYYGIYKTKKTIYFSDDILAFEYIYECSAGGMCEKTEIAIFKDKQLTDKLEIGHDYRDLSGASLLTFEISDNIIRLLEKEIKYNELENGEIEEEIVSDEKFTKVLNLESGKFE